MSGDSNLGELTVEVNEKGLEETAQRSADAAAAGGEVDGGAGAAGALPAGLSRALAPLAFLGLLASLKPIQAALTTVLGIFEALLAPFLLLGLRLLSPVLQLLIDVLPALLSFLDDPVGSLIGLGEFIVDVIKDLPENIWDFVERLPDLIATALEGLFDFLDGGLSDGISEITGEEDPTTPFNSPFSFGGPVLPNIPTGALGATTALTTGGGGDGGGGGPGEIVNNINFTGGLSTFVERVNRNDNFGFPL